MNTTKIIMYDGKPQEYSEVMKSKGLTNKREVIRRRILRGWKPQKAIDVPINKYVKK